MNCHGPDIHCKHIKSNGLFHAAAVTDITLWKEFTPDQISSVQLVQSAMWASRRWI